MTPPPAELVPLIRTADAGLLPVIRATLDAAGIPYFVQGETASGLLPVTGSGLFRQEAFGATILVPEDRLEEARELLQQTAEVDSDPEAGGGDPGGASSLEPGE